jgi:hypothetical protein
MQNYGDFMSEVPNLNDISDLVFYTNRALQCEIRPNMRKVSVAYNKQEKKFTLFLYYDKPLSEEEINYDVAGTIIAEISSNFPNSINILWEDEILVIPYPKKLPEEGVCVFRRYEPSPDTES